MKRISSARLILAAVFVLLCGIGLAGILTCPSPVHADEQPRDTERETDSDSKVIWRPVTERWGNAADLADLRVASRRKPTPPPLPAPCQIALHVKILRVDETKLKGANIDLGKVIGGKRAHVPDYKNPQAIMYVATRGTEFASLLLDLLTSSGAGKVLAEPTIVIPEGRPGSIQVGSEVPILAVDETVNGERRTSIRHQAIGQIFCVEAKLAGENMIRLDIKFANNKILPADEKGVLAGVELRSRKIESTVELRLDQTAILAEPYATMDSEADAEAARLLVAVTPSLISPSIAARGSDASSKSAADGKPVSGGRRAENTQQNSSSPDERRVQRVDSSSILGELRGLRKEVESVRRDVNRLIELLENRQGSEVRMKDEETSEPASKDVSAEYWDMTLREAITIALQNSEALTVAPVESTTQGPITIHRSNTDMSSADAKDAAANVVADVERAYWDSWRAYRNLDTMKAARDASLESWRGITSEKEASDIALQRDAGRQYFVFRGKVVDAWRAVYVNEQRMRFLLGLPSDDGRLIRPCEAPSLTRTRFDWNEIRAEALENRAELTRQRWRLRQREAELAATKAAAKPATDAWNAYFPPDRGQLPPLGERTLRAGERNAQMLLAREQAMLEEIELSVVSELTGAIRNLDMASQRAQTYANRRKATERVAEVLADRSDSAASDALADAQSRRAAATIDYWKSLANFANALSDVHLKKGTLLSYRNIVTDDSSPAEREKGNGDVPD